MCVEIHSNRFHVHHVPHEYQHNDATHLPQHPPPPHSAPPIPHPPPPTNTNNTITDTTQLQQHIAQLQQANAQLQQQLAEAHVRISEVVSETIAASTPVKVKPGSAPETCTRCKGALTDPGSPTCAACGAPHEAVCARCGLSSNLPVELKKAQLLLTATRAALESVAKLKTSPVRLLCVDFPSLKHAHSIYKTPPHSFHTHCTAHGRRGTAARHGHHAWVRDDCYQRLHPNDLQPHNVLRHNRISCCWSTC